MNPLCLFLWMHIFYKACGSSSLNEAEALAFLSSNPTLQELVWTPVAIIKVVRKVTEAAAV